MFSLEQAERLLPQLDGWLRAAIEGRKQIAEIESEYADTVRLVSTSGGRVIDVAYWMRRKKEEEEWTTRLRDAAGQIENCGCVVKDLDIGLIDFPFELDGREVYLCWKLGEPSIAFWHNTDEGFAGRKPINSQFREGSHPSRPI